MKRVINIDQPEEEYGVAIELTHYKGKKGWMKEKYPDKMTREVSKIVYLGKCNQDGDMFAVYHNGFIYAYKGELNSGMY